MKYMLSGFFLALLISGSALSATSPSSIEIHNVSSSEFRFLLNGEFYSLEEKHSLRVPCYQDEVHSLAYGDKVETINCGAIYEVGQ